MNGEPLASHVLRDGDLVELGQTLFLYREIEEDASGRARSLDPREATPVHPGLETLDPNLARQFERLARVAASPLSIATVKVSPPTSMASVPVPISASAPEKAVEEMRPAEASCTTSTS